MPARRRLPGSACRSPRPASLAEISLDYPGQTMPVQVQVQDGGVAVLQDRRQSVLDPGHPQHARRSGYDGFIWPHHDGVQLKPS